MDTTELDAGNSAEAKKVEDKPSFEKDTVKPAIDLIKTRSPEQVHKNFERNLSLLKSYYLYENPTQRLEDLEYKSKIFEDFYAKELFPYVAHGLGFETTDRTMLLKSTTKMAEEQGVDESAVSKKQGQIDTVIGNTDMVFANFLHLHSRSFGQNVYQISSKEGWAVPIDIADVRTIPTDDKNKPEFDDETHYKELLTAYSHNIYSIPDFEKFFSSFAATFFETPGQAIGYLRKVGEQVTEGRFWSDDVMEIATRGLEDPGILANIKKFYKRTGVIPPIVPEYQFKGQVEARRLGIFFELTHSFVDSMLTPKELSEKRDREQRKLNELAPTQPLPPLSRSTALPGMPPPSGPPGFGTAGFGIPGKPIDR